MVANLKLQAAFMERCRSLIIDGYTIVANTDTREFHYIKMRHANGKYISVIAHYGDMRIVQRTNGVITHDEKMC